MFFNTRRKSPIIRESFTRRGGNHTLRWGSTPSSVAPYVPTPPSVVRRMLELAKVGADDVVYDLGCGDGRILFTAVEEFDVRRAVGYELNSSLYDSVQRRVDGKSLGGRIEVIKGNFFLADLSTASVVTLYLTTSGNSKLRPKFEEELQGGSRVVSHDFPIRGWRTRNPGSPDHYAVGSHKIYLYKIPGAYETEDRIHRTHDEGRWRRIRELFRFEGRR